MYLSFTPGTGVVLAALIIISALSVKAKKLTVPAGITGGITGLLIFAGAGYTGLLMLGAFFLLGVLATSHRKELKGGAHSQTRTAGQVLANGGTAAFLALLAIVDPIRISVYVMMLAASLASATSDTLSSELGMVYGRRFYNILSFKKEPKGLDGVVSLEGTLIGVAGAAIIAVIYAWGYGFDVKSVFVAVGGVAGNLADSVLGASLERRKYMGNDAVNLVNTVVGAAVAGGCYLLL